jgi:hypothetical protein
MKAPLFPFRKTEEGLQRKHHDERAHQETSNSGELNMFQDREIGAITTRCVGLFAAHTVIMKRLRPAASA